MIPAVSALPSATRLGPYEIVAPIGAGGMGEVYRARDTRLDRTVAIKVLLAHAAADQEFRDRFDREARAVSALNHPHICALYDVGQAKPTPGEMSAAAVDFLVMEFVDGETLGSRIGRGALPIADVLAIGAQIAQALDAAHRRGIVHRDLKPGNVMLTKSGVKLLDFGLAKLTGVSLGTSHPAAATAFAAQPMTAKGTILGTLQYMAPEQLHGQEADHRADIFALGAILYEMVTGQRAFDGATSATVISAIVEKEPAPPASIQPMTPPALGRVIRACLAKEPDDRVQSAHDVLLQLRWIAEGGSEAGVAAPVAGRRRFQIRVATIAAVVFGLSTLMLGAMLMSGAPPVEPLRFTVASPEGTAFASHGDAPSGWGHQFALSPDGTRIVFVAAAAGQEPRLWVRRFDAVEATPLAGTEGASSPFWSPDSRSIGYAVRDSRLDRIDANGGPPMTICRVPALWSASWGPDQTILVATGARQGLMRVPAGGGTLAPVTSLDAAARDIFHAQPEFLPDGRFLYSVNAYGNTERTGTYLGRLGTADATRILPGVFSPVAYLPPGHLLFIRAGVLMSVSFDLSRGVVTGEMTAVTPETGGQPRRLAFSVSRNGRLAFASAPEPRAQLVWYDRSGTRGQPVGPEARGLRDPEISPDRRNVALSYVDVETGLQNIWITDLQRGVPSRLTTGWAVGPLWSPDSSRMAFAAVPTGTLDVMVQHIGGSGTAEPLITSPDWNFPAVWTRDGFLVYDSVSPVNGWDILAQAINAKDRKPIAVVTTPFHTWQGQVSPDSHWIAYSSDETTPPDVYVQAFPGGAGKARISTAGGRWPRWSRDGRELYYIAVDGTLTAAVVEVREGRFEVRATTPLFKVRTMEEGVWHAPYDVGADGRFLVNDMLVDVTASPITVVVNWKPGPS